MNETDFMKMIYKSFREAENVRDDSRVSMHKNRCIKQKLRKRGSFIILNNPKGSKIESEHGGLLKIKSIKGIIGGTVNINNCIVYRSEGFNNRIKLEVRNGDVITWDEGSVLVSFSPFIFF